MDKIEKSNELFIAHKELSLQNKEKEKRAAELVIANKELAFQNQEKEKRADELDIANKELAFQNKQKDKRAAELVIANKELAFQKDQKEKRAAELVIANKELAIQNEQKEKRAAELVIANKELAFQNEQKDKRATELIIANKELAFQNEEKEKRAAELVIANKDLAFENEEKKKRSEELINSNKEVDELEKRVQERTKDLESFSYSVSHDLRAPLRAINGYAKMIKEDYTPVLDNEGKRFLGEVINNAKKMGVLIDDLLKLSRLGRKAINKSKLDINNLVLSALNEINESTPYITEVKYSNLLPAYADYNLLRQVFINLLSNAIKYSSKKESSLVEIKSMRKNGELIYSISDNGAGFDMHYSNKLFGVFQRLHSNEEFSGTGVGLAIVHRIIQKHDGKVWAEGKENLGATFYFSLPDLDRETNR